jgi:oligogalacturonide lyase
LLPFSRRRFLALAAAGRLTPPEWKRYADPATELEVVRLTDPAFTSGMSAPHLRQFTRRSDSLLYWSERAAGDSPGPRQAFLLDLKMGGSRQLTDAATLDISSLSLSTDDRSALFFDGPSLYETLLTSTHPRELHRVPDGATRKGFAIGMDGSLLFAERDKGKSRIISVLRQITRRVAETDQEIDEVMARPRRMQVLYRAAGQLWLVNSDGTGKLPLKTEPGQTLDARWIPSGRTVIYLHVPDDPKELVTLRENSPDEGTDRVLAKTSQFISVYPNADASVFTGASRSKANAYVLILLRVARRELTLCEHRASDPAMVEPVFTPDSQSIVFVSDRHGKPAIYQVRVARFVEETSAEPA